MMKKKAILTITTAFVLVCFVCLINLANPTRKTVEGKFYGDMKSVDGVVYYQFRSDDDTVWWRLTEQEIGHVPNATDVYKLTYDNNGTTAENKPCDCEPEFKCECEVYDDTLIKIEKK